MAKLGEDIAKVINLGREGFLAINWGSKEEQALAKLKKWRDGVDSEGYVGKRSFTRSNTPTKG